jgi:hypothetical protein
MSDAADDTPAPPGSGASSRHEVVLHLDRVRDLFGPPALDEFGGSADLASGIERLVVELLAARPRSALRTSIVVPEAEVTPGLEDRVQDAVRRYCDLKLTDLEHRRATLRHEGWAALLTSAPLLVVCLLLTALVSHTGLPELWDTVLGDGLLLVLAWVVLWYPLDTLLWYGRPLAHEIRVVRAMGRMDIAVRAENGPAGEDRTAGVRRGADVDLGRSARPSRADAAYDSGGRRGTARLRLGGPGRPRAGR